MRYALFLPLVLALAACDDGVSRVEVLVTDHPDVVSEKDHDRLAIIELVSFKEGEKPRDFEWNELEAQVEYQETPGGEIVTVPTSSLRLDLGRDVNPDSKWGVHDTLVLAEWEANVFSGPQPAGTTWTVRLLKKGVEAPHNEIALATWQLE